MHFYNNVTGTRLEMSGTILKAINKQNVFIVCLKNLRNLEISLFLVFLIQRSVGITSKIFIITPKEIQNCKKPVRVESTVHKAVTAYTVAKTNTEQLFFKDIQTVIHASQYPQIDDFVMRSENDSGDNIILNLNVYKILKENNEFT